MLFFLAPQNTSTGFKKFKTMLLGSSTGLPNSVMSHLFHIPYTGSQLKKKKEKGLTLNSLHFALNLWMVLPLTTLSPSSFLYSFSAAPFFCRHPSVQNTILSHKSSGQCSFSYQAPTTLSKLPASVRHISSVSSFKSSLKRKWFWTVGINCRSKECWLADRSLSLIFWRQVNWIDCCSGQIVLCGSFRFPTHASTIRWPVTWTVIWTRWLRSELVGALSPVNHWGLVFRRDMTVAVDRALNVKNQSFYDYYPSVTKFSLSSPSYCPVLNIIILKWWLFLPFFFFYFLSPLYCCSVACSQSCWGGGEMVTMLLVSQVKVWW